MRGKRDCALVARRTQVFLREFVVLFGFLNGLWLAIGVNPGAELFEVLRGIVAGLASGEAVLFLLNAVPLAFVALMLLLIYRRGGWLGFLAVGAAFLAGLWLLSAPRTSFVLLVAALGLGFVASR